MSVALRKLNALTIPKSRTDGFTMLQDEHMRDELREMARIYRGRGRAKLAAEVDALAAEIQERMNRCRNNGINGSVISPLDYQKDA